jgi:hypothetical protein
MLIAAWILIAFLLAFWSLAMWGVHALLSLDPAGLVQLKPLVDQMPYGAVIERWVPGWQELLRLAIDLTQKGLAWLGDLAPAIVWTAWSLGALMLLGLGGVLTLIVRLVRRSAVAARPAAA